MNRKERAVRGMEAGLTLVELIVGLSILAILMALASPSFTQYLRNTEVTAAQNDLVTAFNLARSEAIRRSVPVSACASDDALTCSNADDWSRGWIVFVDAAGDPGKLDVTDELLQSWQSTAGPLLKVENLDDASFIRYAPTGMVLPTDTRRLTVQTDKCPAGTRKLTVTIAPMGAIRNKRENCA
jgi:type IV fimbrial biogenesis protein FimT